MSGYPRFQRAYSNRKSMIGWNFRVAYCTIFNTSHFSFNHVSLSYFSSVRTYFFHCFFEYFSLSSSYLTNASLPNPFFNFFPHSLVLRAPSRMLVSSRFASLQDLEISRSSQSKKVRPKSFSRALVTDRKKPVFHAFASSSNCSMADLSSRII